MGKFIRRCLMIALIMILVGFLLAAAISAVKGQDYINALLVKLTGGRITFLIGGMDHLEEWFESGEKIWGNIVSDNGKEYDIEDSMIFDQNVQILEGNMENTFTNITSIDLELGGCELISQISEDGRFYVKAENMGKVQVYEEKGCLYVKAMRKAKEDVSKCKLYLFLPVDAGFDEFQLEMGAGAVSLGNITANVVELEVGAGQIKIEELTAHKLEASIGAGEVILSDMSVEELEVSVGAGQFVTEGAITGNANVECAMGNIELTLYGSEKDFNYELECMAGNIKLGGSSYSGLAIEKKIDNNALKEMNLECAMGQIWVKYK